MRRSNIEELKQNGTKGRPNLTYFENRCWQNFVEGQLFEVTINLNNFIVARPQIRSMSFTTCCVHLIFNKIIACDFHVRPETFY